MRIFWGSVITTLVIAAISGAATTWDGGYFFFQLLDLQTPMVVHNRLFVIPIQWIVIAVSHVTANPNILKAVMGLSYGIYPLIGLVAAWIIVRKKAPHLFVWSVIGSVLVMLPGQISFTTEAIIAMHLYWPILLAVLVGVEKQRLVIVILLLIILLFTHPFAVVLFGFTAVVAYIVEWFYHDNDHKMWLWVYGCTALAGIAALRFLTAQTSYEADRITSIDTVIQAFNNAISGLPLIALVCTFLVALIILAAPVIFRRIADKDSQLQPSSTTADTTRLPRRILALYSVELLLLFVILAMLLIWANDYVRWRNTISFRTWTLFLSVPFMILAIGDSFISSRHNTAGLAQTWKHRIHTIELSGFIFLIVLGAQSVTWSQLTSRLLSTINTSQDSCIPVSGIDWIKQTPLNHWSIVSYSAALQGETPRHLLGADDNCINSVMDKALPIAQFDAPVLRDWKNGWFNFSPVHSAIDQDKKNESCAFIPSTWNWLAHDRTNWWRSSIKVGQLLVRTHEDRKLQLRGELRVVSSPADVRIRVNGQTQDIFTLSDNLYTEFDTVFLELSSGENIIEFVVEPTQQPSEEDQLTPLTIYLQNPRLVYEGNTFCNFLQNSSESS